MYALLHMNMLMNFVPQLTGCLCNKLHYGNNSKNDVLHFKSSIIKNRFLISLIFTNWVNNLSWKEEMDNFTSPPVSVRFIEYWNSNNII